MANLEFLNEVIISDKWPTAPKAPVFAIVGDKWSDGAEGAAFFPIIADKCRRRRPSDGHFQKSGHSDKWPIVVTNSELSLKWPAT